MEKQFRFHTQGDLPVCYLSEEEGQYLYILPDAVTAYTDATAAAEARALSLSLSLSASNVLLQCVSSLCRFAPQCCLPPLPFRGFLLRRGERRCHRASSASEAGRCR